jgi:hypothetical protein
MTKGSLLHIDPRDELKYLQNPQELHAYISNIINEMKDFVHLNKTSDFYTALKSSNTWNWYENVVFTKKPDGSTKNPRLRNKMVSKFIYWWNHDKR